MVFEFPELQGTMGGVYAREEGHPEPVWKAIYYQYLPIAVEADAPPSKEKLGGAAIVWAAVALADKVDTFVALTSAGERATGSRDPFALRRQIQGAVRILMDLPELTGIDVEVALVRVFERASQLVPGGTGERAAQLTVATEFARERVRFILEHRGYEADLVRAATSSSYVIPLQARRVVEALRDIRRSEDFQALAVLFKRVKNITHSTRADGARSGQATEGLGEPLDREALTEPAEQALLVALDAAQPDVAAAAARADYTRAFTAVAALRPAVDRFFTEVFVMAEDARVRTARLTLMATLRDLILALADISEIVPHTE
jgi:glycyl-tRNA synthetase beta chain